MSKQYKDNQVRKQMFATLPCIALPPVMGGRGKQIWGSAFRLLFSPPTIPAGLFMFKQTFNLVFVFKYENRKFTRLIKITRMIYNRIGRIFSLICIKKTRVQEIDYILLVLITWRWFGFKPNIDSEVFNDQEIFASNDRIDWFPAVVDLGSFSRAGRKKPESLSQRVVSREEETGGNSYIWSKI